MAMKHRYAKLVAVFISRRIRHGYTMWCMPRIHLILVIFKWGPIRDTFGDRRLKLDTGGDMEGVNL